MLFDDRTMQTTIVGSDQQQVTMNPKQLLQVLALLQEWCGEFLQAVQRHGETFSKREAKLQAEFIQAALQHVSIQPTDL
jgi:hypothetical protein